MGQTRLHHHHHQHRYYECQWPCRSRSHRPPMTMYVSFNHHLLSSLSHSLYVHLLTLDVFVCCLMIICSCSASSFRSSGRAVERRSDADEMPHDVPQPYTQKTHTNHMHRCLSLHFIVLVSGPFTSLRFAHCCLMCCCGLSAFLMYESGRHRYRRAAVLGKLAQRSCNALPQQSLRSRALSLFLSK